MTGDSRLLSTIWTRLQLAESLRQHFEGKDFGELHYFLGVKIIQNQETMEVWMGQAAYFEEILEKIE